MAELENIRDWRGEDVVDRNDEKIGKLEDVYFDSETDAPVFAAVKTGLLGRKLTFVPLAEASAAREHLRVSHQKAEVKDAPTTEPDAELSEDEERQIYEFYGLGYSPAASGRRLTRH
jgi:uncharacterized protein YrrD